MNITSGWINFGKEWNDFSVKLPYSDLDPVDVQNSPLYYNQALWVVCWLCVLEYIILLFQEKPIPPPHENLLSMCHACFNYLCIILTRSLQYEAYVWIWKFSFFSDYFSDGPWSFLGSVLLIDFGYYWFHRASHELMIFWAIHQVHHSSEDITASVGLRHSPLQNIFSWMFYLPFALVGLPPSHFVFHVQFNLFYQTWIHTNAVDNLGILEYVFNTPSKHRVHHGSTKYCIDKNFAGIFIFWDILFGTFEKEKDDIEIVYGIIIQPDFFNLIQHQVFYMKYALEKARSMHSWKNFFLTFVFGPSWVPGGSRLGNDRDETGVIGTRARVRANTGILIDSYVLFHLVASIMHCTHLAQIMGVGRMFEMVYSIFIISSLTNFGFLYEGKTLAATVELYRCLFGVFLCINVPSSYDLPRLFVVPLYLLSLFIWVWPSKIHETKFGLRSPNKDAELKLE